MTAISHCALVPSSHCANCRRMMALGGVCYHCGGTRWALPADYQRWALKDMLEGNRRWEIQQKKLIRIARRRRDRERVRV